MKNTMGSALNALKDQVKIGFAPKSDRPASTEKHVDIDRPVRIGELIQQAETARDDLRLAGYGR